MTAHSKKIYLFILVVLTVIGFLLRIYRINSLPPPDVDEYGVGYNAYSIATTGQDEWGFKFPLFFRSFGDYKLPLDIYFSSTFFKLFKPSITWLRAPAIIFGTLYIPSMYLFIQLLFNSSLLALFGAFLMTFSPYGIFFSRISSASISQSFLTFSSILMFLYFLKNNKKVFIVLSFLLLSLSLYAYPSAWIAAPLMAIGYIFVLFISGKKHFTYFILIFFIFLIPIIWQFFSGGSSVRLEHSTFSSGIILEINEFRHHTNNDIIVKFFHNKLTYSIYTFLQNYVKHFDLSYLIFKEANVVQQRSPYPPVYFILIPFYYLGLIFLFKNYKKPIILLILLWIFISPLPSALTEGAVNPKRYLTFLGSDIVIILGGIQLTQLLKKGNVLLFITSILILQICHFIYFFFITYQSLSLNLYFKGNTISDFVKKYYQKADVIVYSTEELGEPQIYPLFSLLYPSKKYVAEKKYKYISNWYYIKPFDKFYYSNELNDISQKVSDNIYSKKIIGLFSEDELTKLIRNNCYQTLEKYIQIQPYKIYRGVSFKSCQ